MDNCTYPYNTGSLHGHTSFECYPCHQDQHFTCYKGMHFSSNHIDQRKVLVRTSTKGSFSESNIKNTLHLHECAQTYLEEFFKQDNVKRFLRRCGITLPPVSFIKPVSTRLASTARCVNTLFRVIKGHNKQLKNNEWVLIEERQCGDYFTFDDEGQRTMETDGIERRRTKVEGEGRRTDYDSEMLLSSFCHYTLASSGQTLVVSGFNGVQTGRGILLSRPYVHSVGQTFGTEDQGKQGIEHFVKKHKCNSLCKHLPLRVGNRNREHCYSHCDIVPLVRTNNHGIKHPFFSAQVPVVPRHP